MRVLYDHQMFAIQRYGGITRVFVELARRLSAMPGCEIHWYRGLHTDQYDIRDFHARLARYWGVSRSPLPLKARSREVYNRLGLRWFVRTTRRRYDLYHPTYYDASLPGVVNARRLAVTVHDMIPERYLADQTRFHAMISDKRRLVEVADLVLVNSHSTRRDLVQVVPTAAAKIRVTYWATSVHETPPASLPQSLRGRPFFLYVGTRSKYKNFSLVMQAFAQSKRLSEFTLVCFGGTGGYVEPERQFLRDHALEDRFLYLSGTDALLRALYEGAIALVYTSRYEGFGLPPLEAMRCGCPVLCCPTSSLPEVVGDAGIDIDPDSPGELAERMRAVAEDGDLRRELIRKGAQQAERFSWDRTTAATWDAYRAITDAS